MSIYFGNEDWYLQSMGEMHDILNRDLDVAKELLDYVGSTDYVFHLDKHMEEKFIKYYQLGYDEGTYDAKADFNMFLRSSLETLIDRYKKELDTEYLNKVQENKLNEDLLILKGRMLQFASNEKDENESKLKELIEEDIFRSSLFDLQDDTGGYALQVGKYYISKLNENGPGCDEVQIENAYIIGVLRAYIDYFDTIK